LIAVAGLNLLAPYSSFRRASNPVNIDIAAVGSGGIFILTKSSFFRMKERKKYGVLIGRNKAKRLFK
jgi:hypothetical protein